MALFSASLLSEIQSRGDPLHGSYLVSILLRDEPQILAFREAMEMWFLNVPAEARNHFTRLLWSVDSREFFQGFSELAIHQQLWKQRFEIKAYPVSESSPFFLVASPQEDREFYLSVDAFIPEEHPHFARRIYRAFVDELNKIRHHYRFAVYLRRWLPPDFEPTVVRKALEAWFNRLENDPQGGHYAEYRDGGVHVEFSVLGRLPRPSDGLVGFNLTPLETMSTLGRFRDAIEARTLQHRQLADSRRPLVTVLFNNDEWQLGDNYLYEFFYGKARMSLNWHTLGGRREVLRDFSSVFAQSVFNTGRGEDLGAVVLAEKLWRDDGVDVKLRSLHNPWCRRPLPSTLFAEQTALKVMCGTTPEEMIVRWTHLEDLIVHLT